MTREDLEVAVQNAMIDVSNGEFGEDEYTTSELYDVADKLAEAGTINFKLIEDLESMEIIAISKIEVAGRDFFIELYREDVAIQTLSDIVDVIEDAQEVYDLVYAELGKYFVKVS